LSRTLLFWAAFILTRPLGAVVGDFLYKPLNAGGLALRLSNEIDERAEQELHPIDERHFPTEVRPFAVAFICLLARVAQAMDTQRRFVADAAHELRSPLTALSLQAERLAEAEMSSPTRERLSALRQGIERGRNLLDQLLTLAKVQSTESPKSPVSVQRIYRRVLEDLMPLAEAKRIDIGVEGEQDAQVWVSEPDMIAVVKNLVDNAIRYTPERGRVDLSVSLEKGHAGAAYPGHWARRFIGRARTHL
jgi:two-component system OmpR family sensor kinase